MRGVWCTYIHTQIRTHTHTHTHTERERERERERPTVRQSEFYVHHICGVRVTWGHVIDHHGREQLAGIQENSVSAKRFVIILDLTL